MSRMKSRTVHMVMADTDYDGSDALRAFTTKAAADAFADKCREYSATRPQAPAVVEATAENDAEWDRYQKRSDRWDARHPAGKGNTFQDQFSVVPIKLYGDVA